MAERKPFISLFGKELLSTAARWGENIPGATLAKGIGTALASPYIDKFRQDTLEREEELQEQLMQQLREARRKGDKAAMERLKKVATGAKITLPGEKILEDAPNTRQIVASGASLALIAAMGFKPSLRGLDYIKSGRLAQGFKLKQSVALGRATARAAKEAKLVGAGAGKRFASKFIKPVSRSAAEGAAFFGASKASERDADVDDIIRAAEHGALIGGGLTAGFIGIGTGIGAYQRNIAPKLSEKWQALVRRIENTAEGLPAKEPGSQIERTLSGIDSQSTVKRKSAQALTQGIAVGRNFRSRLVDRFFPAFRVQKKLEAQLGRPLKESEKVHRDFSLADATADGKTEVMTDDFLTKIGKYSDIDDKYTAWLIELDKYDRVKLGNIVKGKETVDQVAANLTALAKEIGPTNMQRIKEVRHIVSNYSNNLLKLRREAGLITDAEIATLNKTHPYYIPHNVIMDIDEMALNRISGSMNVAKTDLAKAIGSTRKIEDPIVAIVNRTQIANRVIERNNVLNNLVRVQETHNAIPGMKPLVTSKQVLERREAFKELAELKKELGRVKDSIGLAGIENKAFNAKILKAEKRVEELLNQGLAATVKEADDDLFRLIKNEIDKAYSVPVGAKLESTLPKVDILKYGQVNTKTFEGIQALINNHPQLNSQAKSKLIIDFQKGLAAKGKITVPANITGTELAKDIAKVVQDNRSETVRNLLAKYQVGKVKGMGAGRRTTTAFGLNRKILEKKFAISKTENLVATSEKKIDDLMQTFGDKEIQVRNVLDDIQDLAVAKKESGEQTINLFRDGIKESWVVPNDIAFMVKNLSAKAPGLTFRIATGPAKALKKLSTQFNLSFAVPNLFRDRQTAALTANAFIEELAKKTGVTPRSVNLGAAEIKRLYKTSGGLGASIFKEGETLMIKKGIQKPIKEFANPVKIVDTINNAFEQSTRLETFRRALIRGLSPKDAAFVARQATIDFGRMGTWMKSANQVVPFLNARIQALLNVPKALAAAPEVFARMQFYTAVIPSLALHRHNTRYESYSNISQYFKNKYWVVMVGEHETVDPFSGNTVKIPQFITVPKGEGQSLVANPIQFYLEKSDGIDPRKTRDMIIETLGSFSPLEFQQFDQSDWVGTLISQFGPIPTSVAGRFSGKHPFFGTQIIPRSRQDAPIEQQVKPTTPLVTREAAKILNMSPAMLEFYINAWGGVPQDVQRVIDFVFDPEKLEKTALTDTRFGVASKFPIIRRFAREASPYYSPQAIHERDIKRDISRDVTGEKLTISDQAEDIIKTMSRMKTRQEKSDYLKSLGEDIVTTEVIEKIFSIKKSRESVEALRKNDSVEVRARYINERIKEMKSKNISREEMINFLQDLVDAKILTTAVKERMAELIE